MVSWIYFSASLDRQFFTFLICFWFHWFIRLFVGQLGIDSIFHLLLVGFDLYYVVACCIFFVIELRCCQWDSKALLTYLLTYNEIVAIFNSGSPKSELLFRTVEARHPTGCPFCFPSSSLIALKGLSVDCITCDIILLSDGCIMHCGILSSCQSAATSEIVKALLGMCSSCKQRCIEYWTFTFILLTWSDFLQ